MKRTFRQVVNDGWKILREDIYGVRGVIIALALYFLFFRYILRSICPVVLVTGFPCPGCGMTRAAFCVLHLDFAGAWQTHPFIFPIILLAAVFCLEPVYPGQKAPAVVEKCVVALAVAMILFYLWRMYLYFPGKPPMSYYGGNLLPESGNFYCICPGRYDRIMTNE